MGVPTTAALTNIVRRPARGGAAVRRGRGNTPLESNGAYTMGSNSPSSGAPRTAPG